QNVDHNSLDTTRIVWCGVRLQSTSITPCIAKRSPYASAPGQETSNVDGTVTIHVGPDACRAALGILQRLKEAGPDLEVKHGIRPQLRSGIFLDHSSPPARDRMGKSLGMTLRSRPPGDRWTDAPLFAGRKRNPWLSVRGARGECSCIGDLTEAARSPPGVRVDQ